jgi:hypothetical protein
VDQENPGRVAETFIQLRPDALDRAYELALAFKRGECRL